MPKLNPLPLLLKLGNHIEGTMILDDAPNDYGLLLWQAFRNVLLWAGTAVEDRGALFGVSAKTRRCADIGEVVPDGAPERPALLALAEILDSEKSVGAQAVAAACEELQRIAEQRGQAGVLLAFAIATAAVLPADAARAYEVAALLRRYSHNSWADAWYRRTAELAREARDWKRYGLAYIGIGHLASQQGEWDAAERYFKRALNSSRRYGVWQVRCMALHNLFTVAVTQENHGKATRFARETFNAYGPNHPRLAALAHDIAFFWMMRGLFSQALTVFEALVNHFPVPQERFLALSNVARSAGGAGDLRAFEKAWTAALPLGLELANTGQEASTDTEAWVNLAYGAASAGDVQRGSMAATAALEMAMRRGQEPERARAEAILGSLRGVRGLKAVGRADGDLASREASASADLFARDILHALAHA